MFNIDKLIQKINNKEPRSESLQFSDIIPMSLLELRCLARGTLSQKETTFLYQAARKAKNENTLVESRILSRANPQLANAVHLGITHSPLTRDYNDWFAGRAKQYARPENVASMFSPAAYLTEMYREARELHPESSVWNLDVRRPDLKRVRLNQANQDEEIATLTLAKELLMDNIKTAEEIEEEALLKKLSDYRWTGVTPSHLPYEITRQAILLQDETLSAFTLAPEVAALADPVTLLAIKSDISPELYNILTEELADENARQQIKDNFGNIDVPSFCAGANLARYYHLSSDELGSFGIRYDFSTFSTNETYVENQLSLIVNASEDNPEAWHIRRETYYKDQINYTDLIPLGGEKYKYKFSVTSTNSYNSNFRIVDGKDNVLYQQEGFVPEANKDYDIEISIPDADLADEIELKLQQAKPEIGSYRNASATFRIERQSLNVFLLRINKAIRLSKAAQVSPQNIEQVVMAVNNKLQIDAAVLSTLFYSRYYTEQYAINFDDALILCGCEISLYQPDGKSSQFDRLFNAPPLNGMGFFADGSALDLQPGQSTDTFRLAVLKRAFQVNGSELYTLWQLAEGGAFTCTLKNLSTLYRAHLLADIYHFSVNELMQLLSVSPFADIKLASLSSEAFTQLVLFLMQTARWLAEQKWSVGELHMMLTTRYSTQLTPDIENLLQTLRNGLDTPLPSGQALITSMSPLIAASVQLGSADTATGILHWLNQLHPAGLSVDAFVALAVKASTSAEETTKLVTFCQVMGQLALMVRAIALSAGELALVVAQPSRFKAVEALPHDLSTLQSMTHFHALIARSTRQAGTVLAALSESELPPALLAEVLSLDTLLVQQALQEVHPGATSFAYWQEVSSALQWLTVATALHLTPQDIKALLALKYNTNTPPSYDSWQGVADALQAGLSPAQTREMQQGQDEFVTQALEAYYLRNHVPSGTGSIIGSEDLYGYLLIDSQVSAQIKTTRLAEAIASVQLYINRALSGLDGGVSTAPKSRQYFTDWDTYNKRYSTWAGVSELVYYPENYVDPTVRIGQTGMMETLLQEVSQSQLNSDTLETGFKNYLTNFEEIANLSVISGYHDNVDTNEGNTWFIGHSRTMPRQFYWRKLDHSKGNDGRYAANAWSEWKEIVCGMTPHLNLIRPVIFKSRLHVVWVEEEVRKNDDGTSQDTYYRLKISWLRYDGSWASPFTFDFIDPTNNGLKGRDAANRVDDTIGLFCAQYTTENVLAIYLYKKQEKYSKADDVKNAQGIFIYVDMQGVVKNEDELKTVISESYTHLDTHEHAEVNFRITFNDISYTVKPQQESPLFSLTSNANQLSADYAKQTVTLTPEIKLTPRTYFDNIVKDHPWVIDGGYIEQENITAEYIPAATRFLSNSLIPAPVSPEMRDLGFDSFNITFMDAKVITGKIEISGYAAILSLNSRKGFNQGLGMQSAPVFFLTDESGNNLLADIPCLVGSPLVEFWEGTSSEGTSGEPESGQTEFVFFGFVSEKQLNKASIINVLYSQAYTPWEMGDSDTIATLNADELIDISDSTAIYQATVTYPSAGPNDITVSAVRSVLGSNGDIIYSFDPISFPWQELDTARGIERSLTFSIGAGDSPLVADTVLVTVTSVNNDLPISLHHDVNSAQYMQLGIYRTRLNTLFATQLVKRANQGIDAILSRDTQSLPEPKMGQGTYVTLELSRYDPKIHGDSMAFTLYCYKVWSNSSKDIIARGTLAPNKVTTVNLFLPRIEAYGVADNLYLLAEYASGEQQSIRFIREDKNNPEGWMLDTIYSKGTFPGLNKLYGLSTPTEPMDFSGANALYFWELFYYTPMMMFQRLLQEHNFTEALRWMNYVWSPSGYVVNGEAKDYLWNVRPLDEDTSWNATPLDSVDPDAVAQNDPMHYKMTSFMKSLDLLIARGDAAYRQLERDTLNEAKMWYTQALSLLGDEPYFTESDNWPAPQLGDAASQTVQVAHQQALEKVRQQQPTEEALRSAKATLAKFWRPPIVRKQEILTLRAQRARDNASQSVKDNVSRTANSLIGLFLPQINEKLQGYWKLLAQRLYNLRHNLSIDGQPLALPIFAAPADPAALLSAAVNTSQGGGALPPAIMPLYRFPVMLDSARGMVGQLIQFGSTLLNLTERQDAEALSELLQTQGSELMLQSLRMQDKTLAEIDAEKTVLQESHLGAQERFDRYSHLHEEDVNSGEKKAMDLYLSSSAISTSAKALHMSAAAADMVPNIYGMAVGGTRFGALLNATSIGIEIASSTTLIAADKISRSESYRRRRQEWEIQRNNAQAEMKQIDAQLAALAIRREAANLQKAYLEAQQAQMQTQLTFLLGKFSSQALYNWLRGKLSAIYYQFYDLAVSRCLMAEQSWQYDVADAAKTFIKPGVWQGAYAGLLAGESLMLMLGQMEKAYLEQDKRALEVTRTVSLAQVYAGLSDDSFVFGDEIVSLLGAGKGSVGNGSNTLNVDGEQLQATLQLSTLNIGNDYPAELGSVRRIKQISVTLPALVGPYQDVRAVLNYGGSVKVPRGCNAIAVSRGMNDSGQFQLDFNDPRYLPFEGIPVSDEGSLTLSFPDANSKQKELLLSLTDIILHIRYTIL